MAAPRPAAPFPPFDSATFAAQLFWLAIIFGAALRADVARSRCRASPSILEEPRRADRERPRRGAAALKAETDAAIAAYEKALADARAEGAAHRAARPREGSQAEAEARRKALEAELAAKLEAAEATIVAEQERGACGNVRGIAADAAAAIVERLTGQRAGDRRRSRRRSTALARASDESTMLYGTLNSGSPSPSSSSWRSSG